MYSLKRAAAGLFMAFALVLAMTSFGFGQVTYPNTPIGPGLGQPGVTPPSPALGQIPGTTTPTITPNSTLPNYNPNVNPTVSPNTSPYMPNLPNQNIPSPNVSPTPAPNATNPNFTPGVTVPNSVGSPSYGRGGGPVGTGTLGSGTLGTGTYGTGTGTGAPGTGPYGTGGR